MGEYGKFAGHSHNLDAIYPRMALYRYFADTMGTAERLITRLLLINAEI